MPLLFSRSVQWSSNAVVVRYLHLICFRYMRYSIHRSTFMYICNSLVFSFIRRSSYSSDFSLCSTSCSFLNDLILHEASHSRLYYTHVFSVVFTHNSFSHLCCPVPLTHSLYSIIQFRLCIRIFTHTYTVSVYLHINQFSGVFVKFVFSLISVREQHFDEMLFTIPARASVWWWW